MNPVTFQEVAMTEESRIAFAQSVPAFLSLYGFDGIEIDWDKPLDPDEGGDPDNFERLPLLMKEIRNAIDESGEDYLLTFALPPTDWELLDFDIEALAESVDWFNLMTFDYHTPKNIPKTVGSHTDLKLIDYVVTDLVKNTESTKFVLGMAAYGRTYTLADDRCKEISCPFRTPGLGGCGNTPGFLPYAEIAEFVDSGSVDEIHHDVSSSSMVAVVTGDQLISYDDETTWAIKEAYAEMMCLRGVMLWSVDMLKAPESESKKRKLQAIGERSLSSSEAVYTSDSIALSGDSLLGCNLCEGFKLLSGNRVDYAGSEVSCAEMDSMLNTVFIEQDSDQCANIHSSYKNKCCAKAPSKPCDICGTDKVLLHDKQVHYSGDDSSCGKLSTSFLQTMEMTSFTCSLAKTSLKNLCCSESCQMCNANEEINGLALIELDGKQVTCQEYESSLKEAGHLKESEQCASMVSSFADICCSSNAEIEVKETKPAAASCNICHRDDIHHELKAEAMVEYKGASLSCVDVNSILAKNEKQGSEMCDATQSMLFDGCCYEKCSLCGDQELKFDATVKYNKQILSCDEFNQLFSMSVTNNGSKQCDAMKAAYSQTCCYKPPTTPCNLCKDGSNLYELNTHAFVKTRSGSKSSHCKALSTQLFEREDENSHKCLDSKAEYFESCCNTQAIPVHQSSLDEKTTWNNWIADYMAPPSSGTPLIMSIWTYLLTATLVGFVFLTN
jgi:chitinase